MSDLKVENELLRERVRQLETLLTADFIDVPSKFRLTPHQKRIFRALLAHEFCSKDLLLFALFSGRTKDEPESNILAVQISKMRRLLKPHGVVITVVWGEGYSLDSETRAAYR